MVLSCLPSTKPWKQYLRVGRVRCERRTYHWQPSTMEVARHVGVCCLLCALILLSRLNLPEHNTNHTNSCSPASWTIWYLNIGHVSIWICVIYSCLLLDTVPWASARHFLLISCNAIQGQTCSIFDTHLEHRRTLIFALNGQHIPCWFPVASPSWSSSH